MTPEDALKNVDNVLAQVRITRQEQSALTESVQTLNNSIMDLRRFQEELREEPVRRNNHEDEEENG